MCPQVYEDGDKEDMDYAEIQQLLQNGRPAQRTDAAVRDEPTVVPAPQTPYNRKNCSSTGIYIYLYNIKNKNAAKFTSGSCSVASEICSDIFV